MSRRGASCRLGSLRPTARHEKKRLGLRLSLTFGKDALISNDGTHTLTDVTVAAPVGVARTEAEVVGAVRDVRVLSGRPIASVLTSAGEAAAPVASSGQEDTIAVNFAGELPSVHAVECCPFGCAVVKQLLDFVQGRHTPLATPLHMSHVIFRAADVTAKIMTRRR